VVGGRTGLHADQARRKHSEKARHLLTPKLSTHNDGSVQMGWTTPLTASVCHSTGCQNL
jgi:hypothetical protein